MTQAAARTAKPQHYVRRNLRELGLLADSGLPAIACLVVRRIRRNRRLMATGSYVLVDDAGRVYVLSEGVAWTEPMVNRNSGWLVGRYASGETFAFPSTESIEEDILARLNP